MVAKGEFGAVIEGDGTEQFVPQPFQRARQALLQVLGLFAVDLSDQREAAVPIDQRKQASRALLFFIKKTMLRFRK